MGLTYSAGGKATVTIPPPGKKKSLAKYSTEKTNGTYTVVDRVDTGEQWIIQVVSCSTDRTVKSVVLGLRDKGGHIVELAASGQGRDTLIRWAGEAVLSEGEAIVLMVENMPSSNGAVAKLIYRGYKT